MIDIDMNAEPIADMRGRAHVFYHEGALMVMVGEKMLLDLTVQDGRDLRDALNDVLSRAAEVGAARKAGE